MRPQIFLLSCQRECHFTQRFWSIWHFSENVKLFLTAVVQSKAKRNFYATFFGRINKLDKMGENCAKFFLKNTVSLPCFYKRRDKNHSMSKNCHLRPLSYPINEYIFHLTYQRFIPALKRSRFLAKNLRKLFKSLEIFTFFSHFPSIQKTG